MPSWSAVPIIRQSYDSGLLNQGRWPTSPGDHCGAWSTEAVSHLPLGSHSRSKIIAMPWPPPTHMVSRP